MNKNSFTSSFSKYMPRTPFWILPLKTPLLSPPFFIHYSLAHPFLSWSSSVIISVSGHLHKLLLFLQYSSPKYFRLLPVIISIVHVSNQTSSHQRTSLANMRKSATLQPFCIILWLFRALTTPLKSYWSFYIFIFSPPLPFVNFTVISWKTVTCLQFLLLGSGA